ncbi:MAG TPA: phosphatidate cytidylyltransferase, partial [Chitinophagales bacterium]|nr:phosphatidate cytidylyltransferase [Chitinophagales bacterium]
VLGLVVSVAGTFGDLVESMLKRSVQIKDSGSLLPGHGGFLDRFDGFMFAVPAAVFYIDFIR